MASKSSPFPSNASYGPPHEWFGAVNKVESREWCCGGRADRRLKTAAHGVETHKADSRRQPPPRRLSTHIAFCTQQDRTQGCRSSSRHWLWRWYLQVVCLPPRRSLQQAAPAPATEMLGFRGVRCAVCPSLTRVCTKIQDVNDRVALCVGCSLYVHCIVVRASSRTIIGHRQGTGCFNGALPLYLG